MINQWQPPDSKWQPLDVWLAAARQFNGQIQYFSNMAITGEMWSMYVWIFFYELFSRWITIKDPKMRWFVLWIHHFGFNSLLVGTDTWGMGNVYRSYCALHPPPLPQWKSKYKTNNFSKICDFPLITFIIHFEVSFYFLLSICYIQSLPLFVINTFTAPISFP